MTSESMEIVLCFEDAYHELPTLESCKLPNYLIKFRTNPELIKIVKDRIAKGESTNLRIYKIDPRFANYLDLISIQNFDYEERIDYNHKALTARKEIDHLSQELNTIKKIFGLF
jgi:hypothetical protein